MTRILSFDPGFERLGVAVLEKQNGKDFLLFSDCLRTDAALPFTERLRLLGDATVDMLKKWQPSAVALEDVYFAKNAKTAMRIAEVRGMLIYLTTAHDVPLFQYTPLQVKVATTGYGKSDKSAVAMMVSRLIELPPKKRLDDELDAIAVGLTCLSSIRSK